MAVAAVVFFVMGLESRNGGGGSLDASALDRLYAWRGALNMALANPIQSIGLSNFSEALYFYIDRWSGFRDMAAHSTWLTVLAETGFIGFAVFVLMIRQCWRTGLKALRSASTVGGSPHVRAASLGLLAGLGGFCAAGSFLTQAFSWQIYILLALTTATASSLRLSASEPVGRPV